MSQRSQQMSPRCQQKFPKYGFFHVIMLLDYKNMQKNLKRFKNNFQANCCYFSGWLIFLQGYPQSSFVQYYFMIGVKRYKAKAVAYLQPQKEPSDMSF